MEQESRREFMRTATGVLASLGFVGAAKASTSNTPTDQKAMDKVLSMPTTPEPSETMAQVTGRCEKGPDDPAECEECFFHQHPCTKGSSIEKRVEELKTTKIIRTGLPVLAGDRIVRCPQCENGQIQIEKRLVPCPMCDGVGYIHTRDIGPLGRRPEHSGICYADVMMKESEPRWSYVFDFTIPEPYTDDPFWKGQIRRGPHNHVSCDGVEVENVIRCRTGERGWVDVVERYERYGNAQEPHKTVTKVTTERTHGVVWFWTDHFHASFHGRHRHYHYMKDLKDLLDLQYDEMKDARIVREVQKYERDRNRRLQKEVTENVLDKIRRQAVSPKPNPPSGPNTPTEIV